MYINYGTAAVWCRISLLNFHIRARVETNNIPWIHHEMGYPRVKGPSFFFLLHTFSMVSGPSNGASAQNTTLWVIQDTYEGQSFFECVNICSSIEASCANGVVSQALLIFTPVRILPSSRAAFFLNSLALTHDPCSGLVT